MPASQLRSALVLFSFAAVLNFPAIAQQPNGSPAALDATNLTKSTQVKAFKLHGFVESHQGRYEVWLEKKDGKWKLETQHRAGQGAENDFQRRLAEKLAESTGGIVQSILLFDGTKSIRYSPSLSQVRIVPTDKNPASFIDRLLFPESWSSFTPGAKSEKLKYAYLMGLQSANKSTTTKEQGKIVVISEESQSSEPIAFKTKALELDTETGLPIRSKISGGKGLAQTLQFNWEKNGDVFFVKKGIYEMEGQRPWSWTIDNYSTDPSQIASQFTLEELALPFGTRIDTVSVDGNIPTMPTFIGGEDGKEAYRLKQQQRRSIIDQEPAK